MENTIRASQESAKLVGKEVPAMWVLWAYVEAYQAEGAEFTGGH